MPDDAPVTSTRKPAASNATVPTSLTLCLSGYPLTHTLATLGLVPLRGVRIYTMPQAAYLRRRGSTRWLASGHEPMGRVR